MNWEAIGAVGEIIGALAVVITLGYLALQIKTAQKTASDSSRHQRAAGVRDMLLASANNPHLQSAINNSNPEYTAYLDDFETRFGLERSEASTLVSYYEYWWWVHWSQWASIKTAQDEEELVNIVRQYYSRDPMNHIWKTHPDVALLDPPFQEFVNNALANGD